MKSKSIIFSALIAACAVFAMAGARADDTTARVAITRNLAPAVTAAQTQNVASRAASTPAQPTVVGRAGVTPGATEPVIPANDTDADTTISNQQSTTGRAALTSATAARAAATQSQSVANRARAGENIRDIGGTDINTRTEASEKGIINQSAAVRRAGVSLRPSTAEVGGRAIISGTNTMT